jgi:hypothetical protein
MIVLGSFTLALAFGALTSTSLGHGKAQAKPESRSQKQPQQREQNYVNAALAAAVKADPACPPSGGAGNPATVSYGAPSAKVLSALGVLRRPANAADQLPALLDRNGHLNVAPGAAGVYVRYIRRARVADGVSFYIIPVAEFRAATPAKTLGRCYSEEMQALRGQVSHVTGSLRASALSYGATVFRRLRDNANDLAHPGIFEESYDPNVGGGGTGATVTAEGGGTGATVATIAREGIIEGEGIGGHPVIIGVAPSGVATVTLETPAGVGGARPVTAAVVGNVFVVRAALADWGGLPKIIWRSASGHVIKIVHLPSG